jgi:hypothetical protein
MNISLGVIIAIVYLVARVVAAIAKESAKRKEEQRRREEAARRRGDVVATASAGGSAAAQLDPKPASGQTSAPPATSAYRTGTPKEDLAARRREQIDQLRNRRQIRQGLPQAGVARPPDQIAGTSARQSTTADQQEQVRRRQEQERAKALHGKQVRAQQRRQDAEARRDRQKRERAFKEAVRDEPVQHPAAPQVAAAAAAHASSVLAGRHPGQQLGLRLRLKNPESLREGLIIRELLDQPLSLR